MPAERRTSRVRVASTGAVPVPAPTAECALRRRPQLKPKRLRERIGAVMLATACLGTLAGGARADATPMASQLATIDGRQVEFAIGRAAQPRASVVFENGLMLPMTTWQAVAAAFADCCNVVTYNRAGVGLSAMPPDPPTAQQVAGSLHALLQSQRVEPPYVLVGHSLGGQYAQVFASLYPDQVAGLVLVDALPVGTVKPEADFPWYTRLGLQLFAPEYARREIASIHPMGEALLAGPRLEGRKVVRLVAHNDAAAPKAEGLLKDLSKGVILAEDFGVWAIDPDAAEARMDRLYERSVVRPVAGHHRVQETAPQLVIDAIRQLVE